MQTKKGSFAEAVTNTTIGFGTTLVFSPLIYWLSGVEMRWSQVGQVTVYFTLLSVARSYIVRRFFNKLEPKPTPTDA